MCDQKTRTTKTLNVCESMADQEGAGDALLPSSAQISSLSFENYKLCKL